MKKVLVTGGARGIGLSIVKSFLAEDDYFVIVGDVDLLAIEEAKLQLNNFSDRLFFLFLDVSEENSVEKAFKEIETKHVGIDILINNAGISPKKNGRALDLEEISLAEWQRVININLTGSFLCTQKAVKYMKHKNWGRIVHISSLTSRTAASVAGIHYATSKTALLGFSRQVANQFGEYNITSNCIAPGRIESDMSRGVSDEVNKRFIEKIPLKRMGTAEEVAALVKFLSSNNAAYITGTVVDINGGAFMG